MVMVINISTNFLLKILCDGINLLIMSVVERDVTQFFIYNQNQVFLWAQQL